MAFQEIHNVKIAGIAACVPPQKNLRQKDNSMRIWHGTRMGIALQ